MKYIYLFFAILLSGSLNGSRDAMAQTINLSQKAQMLESGKCVSHFKRYEREFEIPSDLLHSIAIQESGRKHEKSSKIIPWPWTVNVEGAGHYFNSKKEAVLFVENMLKKGKKSIDVGCMQISLLYHGGEFRSLSDAFDPRLNVKYGAIFLREKYEQYGSWNKAIANYHSANQELGSKYQKSVLKIASNIDKHKFDFRHAYGNQNMATDLDRERSIASLGSSISRGSIPLSQNRYRSNMMVFSKGT